MAQQPNIELDLEDLPSRSLGPAPARRQDFARPGVIDRPAEMPTGPGFGNPGPDTGYALRIIRAAGLDDVHPRLRQVLTALMGARAAHLGRAPTREDLEVAKLLTGLGRIHSPELDDRRRRWMAAAAHEKSPGRAAVAEVEPTLPETPEHIDLILRP